MLVGEVHHSYLQLQHGYPPDQETRASMVLRLVSPSGGEFVTKFLGIMQIGPYRQPAIELPSGVGFTPPLNLSIPVWLAACR